MELRTFTVTMSNFEMIQKLEDLSSILSQRNILGYLAAYNTRVLTNALEEYRLFEKEAILKYGADELNEKGEKTGIKTIEIGSENYSNFEKELAPYWDIEQEIRIAKASMEDAIGNLSGEEILKLEWMLEGDDILWAK